jgi:hypothetical protein
LRDRARRYDIVVDGQPVAKIKRGQRVELPIPRGRHEVFMRINWGSSQTIDLEIKPGESVELFCTIGRSQIGKDYISLSLSRSDRFFRYGMGTIFRRMCGKWAPVRFRGRR